MSKFKVDDKVQLGDYSKHSDYMEHYGQVAKVIDVDVDADEVWIEWQDGVKSILFEREEHDGVPYSGATLVKYHVGDRVAYRAPHYDDDLMGIIKKMVDGIPVVNFDNGTKGWRPNSETIMYLRVVDTKHKVKAANSLGKWGVTYEV